MNLVLFTGGSGNANLIRYLKTLSFVNLSLLINGYDDGLSTGTIRSANYGMLGPSDYRKNFTYILDSYSGSNQKVKEIFEHRISPSESEQILESKESFIRSIAATGNALDDKSSEFISRYLRIGLDKLLVHTVDIDLINDFSVGNIIIGGLFEKNGDFNTALKELTDFFDLDARLINVSAGDDSKLVAFDSHADILSNEADIVNYSGSRPLKEFFLLPLGVFSGLGGQKEYTVDEIRGLSVIPDISEPARNAIENADLILFGSGTLFSSLLPSYRICKEALCETEAKKVLIVNNQFDNDIQNITLNEYIQLHLDEIGANHRGYFDRVIVDKQSVIVNPPPVEPYPNVEFFDVADKNRKHSGYYLWKSIVRSLDHVGQKTVVKLLFPEKMNHAIVDAYRREAGEFNKSTFSDVRFTIGPDSGHSDSSYYLILDTSGKINLHDIISWIKIIRIFNFNCVFGYRFFSRRQFILSYKKKMVESPFTYTLSLIVSNLVSLMYALRFFKFKADPLSGIYLIRSEFDFHYTDVPSFLKFINKNGIEILSLPITYRTFHDIQYLRKLKSLAKNLVKLFTWR